MQALLEVCDKEQIDTLYPSYDPHVYVCAKNKKRFEDKGVLVVAPDYDNVATLLDKYRTVLAARDAGFPHPKTHLATAEADLAGIADDLGFPIMVRPRSTSGSRGMQIVTTLPDLIEKTKIVTQDYGAPMLQEYIPGRDKQNFYITVDRQGDVKVAFCPRVRKVALRLFRDHTVVCEGADPHPLVPSAARILQTAGWWGGVAVQTKIDPRDGTPKLMEINPRTGAHLWRLVDSGFNVPLMCTKIARGEPVEPITQYPVGTLFVEPVEELMLVVVGVLDSLIYGVWTSILRKAPLDPTNAPPGCATSSDRYEARISGANL